MAREGTPDQFSLREWGDSHPRWDVFARCLTCVAPEQAPFVLGEYSRHIPCYLCVAERSGEVIGFLRFGVQPIGAESGVPPLILDGETLTEAKIHAFAVREEHRCRGIGKALQRWAIGRARGLGCHQLTSHSGLDKVANYRVKLSLGFAAYPEGEAVHFLMPLRRQGIPASRG